MSERLAKLLNLEYKPCVSTAGTAKANQTLHTLGITDENMILIPILTMGDRNTNFWGFGV